MCVPWELNPQPFALLTQCSTTEPQVHNYNSNKCLCSMEWFLKDHVTLKTGVMMLKMCSCHHRNKLHFTIFNCSNVSQCNNIFLLFLLYFWSNSTLVSRIGFFYKHLDPKLSNCSVWFHKGWVKVIVMLYLQNLLYFTSWLYRHQILRFQPLSPEPLQMCPVLCSHAVLSQ